MFYTIEDKNNHLIIIDGGWTSDAGQVWKEIEEHNTIVDLWIITHPDQMGHHGNGYFILRRELPMIPCRRLQLWKVWGLRSYIMPLHQIQLD